MMPCETRAADAVNASASPRIAARAASLASLAGTTMGDRFCFWRGQSGRRYVFSVYPAQGDDDPAAPEYCDAVVIEAERRPDGSRSAVSVGLTGMCPGLVTARWTGHPCRVATERHVHLLAGSALERRALFMDLCGHA